ncbi:MAG: UvrD-helicase domain-containing protein [Dethiosulfatibacter sp.]|nr:UvrD-helicase domain-containing protein [Dethiosulfatibacter sp.]
MVISIDQDHIAKTKPHGPMLITGAKGSGKTAIGLKRAAYLSENYCLEHNDKILFINNSKSFAEHNSYLLEKVEKEKSKTLMDLIQARLSNVDISSIDGVVYQYYKKHCTLNNLSYEIYDEKNYYRDILHKGIDTLILQYPEVKYLDKNYEQFLLAEIEWIRACGYFEEQQYQNADRIGLHDLDWEGPYKLNKNSKSRKAIFELMVYYSQGCKSKGKIDYVQANIMALNSINDGNLEQYTHIIIDDCHEFTKIQLDLIIQLYNPKKHSSITFLFEDNADCDPKSWLGNGRPFTTVGFDMTGRSKILHSGQKDSNKENLCIDKRCKTNYDISYREIVKPNQLFEYVMTLIEENISEGDFSVVFKNGNTSLQIFKSQDLLMIRRNSE